MAKADRKHSIQSTPPDPIFATIENHKMLRAVSLDVSIAEEAGLATESDADRASEASEHAAWKLARTKPTTAAGASAMLAYITVEPAVGLFDLGETRWHATAFRTSLHR